MRTVDQLQRVLILFVCALLWMGGDFLYADTSGPNSPATTVDDATVGGFAWGTPDNVQASNNSYSTASNSIAGQGMTLSSIKLVKGGVISGTEQSGTTIFPVVEAYTSVGGTSDLWGLALTADDVNAVDFGVAVSATSADLSRATHYVKATNFNFTIPAGATINGITVEIEGVFAVVACFVAGTLVDAPQGKIPIEKIREGDLVTALDERSGKTVSAKVRLVLAGQGKPRLTDELIVIHAEHGTVSVTPEHPFYTSSGQRVLANEIKRGQVLKTYQNGSLVDSRVLSVERLKVQQVPVYNFEVEKYHTYVANGFVVHNKGGINRSYFDHVRISVDYTAGAAPPASVPTKAKFGGGAHINGMVL